MLHLSLIALKCLLQYGKRSFALGPGRLDAQPWPHSTTKSTTFGWQTRRRIFAGCSQVLGETTKIDDNEHVAAAPRHTGQLAPPRPMHPHTAPPAHAWRLF